MASAGTDDDNDPEVEAIGDVVSALRRLPKDAQQRVLRYVANKLGMSVALSEMPVLQSEGSSLRGQGIVQSLTTAPAEGISPAASKWMQRSGFARRDLEEIFSIGMEQIELVATNMPGNSKRARMKNVLLLLGIATYLGTGTPRITDEQLREACQHYDAFDSANFASHLKKFGAEVGGNKENGYTLTSRGLVAATALIKGMTKSGS
jgi:hypothetical protein